MRNRIRVVQKRLRQEGLEAFLISSRINIRYLTGFEGSAGLLVLLRDEAFLLVDGRYTLKAGAEAHRAGAQGVIIKTIKNYFEDLADLLGRKRIWRLGFEEDHLTYQQVKRLTLELYGLRLYPYHGFIEKERLSKDRTELELIKKSIDITERALLKVVSFIRPGLTEKEIADEIEINLRREGAKSSSFRTMVACPETASSPHNEPGERKIPSRGFILIDMGCDYQGYNSDLTRIILLDKMNSMEKEIVEVLEASQKKALRLIRPGKRSREIDEAGREVIVKAGWGKYFTHSLGHGVGLEVHEGPLISGESKDILKEGMVFTIEPGIYLPGRLGIRIEDMVLVKKNGYLKLTTLPPKIFGGKIGGKILLPSREEKSII